MRFYLYHCWDCEIDIWLVMRSSEPLRPPADAVCPGCWSLVEQDYTRKNVMPDIFESYVERNLTGEPVEFSSKRQRDEIMSENHATYDSNLFGRGFQRHRWEEDLTFAQAQSMAEGKRAEAEYVPDLD